MRILFAVLFGSLSVHAVTIEKYLSVPEGSLSHAFEFKSTELKLSKNTNYFDSIKSYAVGSFSAPAKGQEDLRKSLEDLLRKISSVDEVLKKKGTSFNEASKPKTAHVVIFRLNEYVIAPGSKYYQVLDETFNKLSNLKWKHVYGYEISKDLKTVKEIRDSKVNPGKKYNADFYCKKEVCSYYGGGHVFK